jgi:hypothetical protein
VRGIYPDLALKAEMVEEHMPQPRLIASKQVDTLTLPARWEGITEGKVTVGECECGGFWLSHNGGEREHFDANGSRAAPEPQPLKLFSEA